LYYGKLLAWTTKCTKASLGWKTVAVRGYTFAEPVFRDIQTDYTNKESCLTNGQMLVEKDDIRLVITVMVGNEVASTWVEASREHREVVKGLVQDIADFLKEHNFYRGKKLSFGNEISFLNTGQRDWASVFLDPSMKKRIYRDTIGYLKHCNELPNFGISCKRGIILSGEPGTGKTAVCKALISEANNITCITTTAYGLQHAGYISDLYAIAQDLSPSIVFIEDLDFVGQERQGFYRGTPPLIALLAEMDGIEEKTGVVTVATTNCVEMLDKALSERPSRFDWICKIPRPNYQLRMEMLKYLSNRIPLSEDIIEYIANKTDGFTPAQVQEVPVSMVATQLDETGKITGFNRQDVDSVISQMNYKKYGAIGFNRM
jgi:cell division protease FtsH